MNWYKKSKSYLDIGHEEIGNVGGHILWYSPDGINIIKSKETADPYYTHSLWGRKEDSGVLNSRYAGRYDVNKKILSLSGTGYGEPTQSLINNLLLSFPLVKKIYIFNYTESEPKVLRVAKKINQYRFSNDDLYSQLANLDTRSQSDRTKANELIFKSLNVKVGDILVSTAGMSSGPDKNYRIESVNPDFSLNLFAMETGRKMPNVALYNFARKNQPAWEKVK